MMAPPDRRKERELRPECCPSCRSKAVGTHAKVITPTTFWHCQACGEGFTMARNGDTSAPQRSYR